MQPSLVRPQSLATLLDEVVELRERVGADAKQRLQPYAARYPGGYTPDAENLANYLALRSHDLRPLQERLVEAGVSSLGRGEAQVATNLDRVVGVLSNALGIPERMDFPEDGQPRLEHNTQALFGNRAHARYARIMVTLPTEAATDAALVAGLVASGMDCARINCAHDGPALWRGMIDNLRAVEAETGQGIRVFMDLAGHKIRTGPVQTGPAVAQLKVPRNAYGQRIGAAKVLLTSAATTGVESERGVAQRLPLVRMACDVVQDEIRELDSSDTRNRDTAAADTVSLKPMEVRNSRQIDPDTRGPDPLDLLKAGDRLIFKDARGKTRKLCVRERLTGGEWLAEITRGAYILEGTRLRLDFAKGRGARRSAPDFRVEGLEGRPLAIRLQRGDALLLRGDRQPGLPARRDGEAHRPAEIGCSHSEVIDALRPGHAVWIDDGKLGCSVERMLEGGALLRVTHAGPKGVRIQSDKGINVPDTTLPLPALTDKDLEDLDFVCANADIVGLSFVRTLGDVDELRRQLAVRGRSDLPIVAKIETAAAVRNLPDILLGTLGQHALGIMIARGDLAVELGSVRMAEIQEEILWICEAAHVSVIWATQVLETLAKNGVINRPEITDAAMSVRAECVMMNKGPYISDAVVVLNDILTRMDAHQFKKVSRLRRLHW